MPGSNLSVGEALLSPTRTYLPVVKRIIEELDRQVLGLVHCSGGGQTKCLRFGTRVHHVKDNLFPVPALFKEIQRASQTTEEEMHQVYNMGHRLEVFCLPEVASKVIELSQEFGVDAKVIGRTEETQKADGANHLYHPAGWFDPSLRVSEWNLPLPWIDCSRKPLFSFAVNGVRLSPTLA